MKWLLSHITWFRRFFRLFLRPTYTQGVNFTYRPMHQKNRSWQGFPLRPTSRPVGPSWDYELSDLHEGYVISPQKLSDPHYRSKIFLLAIACAIGPTWRGILKFLRSLFLLRSSCASCIPVYLHILASAFAGSQNVASFFCTWSNEFHVVLPLLQRRVKRMMCL